MNRIENIGTSAAYLFFGSFAIRYGINLISKLTARLSHPLPFVVINSILLGSATLIGFSVHKIFDAMRVPNNNMRKLGEISFVIISSITIATAAVIGLGYASTVGIALSYVLSIASLDCALIGGPVLIIKGLKRMHEAVA